MAPWTMLLSHKQPHRKRINDNFSFKEPGPHDDAGTAVGILGRTSFFLLTSKKALRKRDSKATQLLRSDFLILPAYSLPPWLWKS